MILAALALASAGCADTELGKAKYIGDVMRILSLRSVSIIQGDPSASKFVSSSADFSLITGDVGSVFDKGWEGSQALGKIMAAQSYEFPVWVTIPTPTDPCTAQQVSVRFFDGLGERGAEVTFLFEDGVLTRAKGFNIARAVGSIDERVAH